MMMKNKNKTTKKTMKTMKKSTKDATKAMKKAMKEATKKAKAKTMTNEPMTRWRLARTRLIDSKLGGLLNKLSTSQPPDVVNLIAAMRYSLLGGGKRLRPLLTLAAAEALGETPENALPGAMAVEMVHAYSLIHDDLPAMDDDDYRRGLPTCHRAFGEATAILAGDALQSLAFETLASLSKKPEWAAKALTAIYVLARAAGPLGLAGGQAQDLALGNNSSVPPDDLAMERRKTGELMAAALGVGAALAGADQKAMATFRRIGLLAGEAFQITDDLLNQVGDPSIMGKPVGSDAKRGKKTSPDIMGQSQARSAAISLIAQAVKLAGTFRSECLSWLLESIIDRTN
jgi:geranylgeranyl diphosphate synthase type II